MRKKILLVAGLVLLCSFAAGADEVTANFDIALDASTVTSQGVLTLTLQNDGSILGQFTAPNVAGYQFINMDLNFVGSQSAANNLQVFFEDPSSSFNGCLAGNGFNCAIQFVTGPVGDTFGLFSFQLDWFNGAPPLTSFDFLIKQAGGFTSVDSLVGLSGTGSCPNPPGKSAAFGCVDFQLFNEPFSYTGAIAQIASSSATPEPGTLLLLGSGLLGLGPFLRTKFGKS